jgi:error-prone DNA polymerase
MGEVNSIEEFTRRTSLDEKALTALAESGAFKALNDSRRSALWQAHGLGRARPTPLPVEAEPLPEFAALTLSEAIQWDYQRSSHSTLGHPLAPLREELRAQGLPEARTLASLPNGRRIRYAGLVICRQRPGTASGVTFMTLEDETGFVNLVLWRQVFEAYAVIGKTQSFLGVTGKLQVQSTVVHLVAEELWVPSVRELPQEVGSRDFH